jgi:putative two-component system response regulator
MSTLPIEIYRYALAQTADSVMITDVDHRIRYVNRAFTRITGFEPEEVLGKTPRVLRSGRTPWTTYRRLWSAVARQGWWRGEFVNRRKNGEEWYSSLSISVVNDEQGDPVAYVGIATDVTEMKRLEMRLKHAGLEAIYMLSVACEAKDESTGSHIARVREYSQALALELGLSPEEAEEIGYSSIMHDVGKLHVPDEILRKPGPLSKEEWVQMRRHPGNGRVILRHDEFYEIARQIAENHHERWDGMGYPAGRQGEEIPLAARIVTVADVFDALATRRPYKDPWPEAEAVDEIRRQSGRAFDPRVVDAFLRLHAAGTISAIRRQFP